ncbi:MAG: hypothetical protein ACXVPD_06735 [Bacteroidia bacterium]
MRITAALILFFSLNGFCQDTIRFSNGDVKPARVTEVGVENIKYYRSDIGDGPLYTVSKSEIRTITYANGHVDTFKVAPKPVQTVAVTQPAYVGMGAYRPQKIRIERQKLVYEGTVLSDGHLLDLIDAHKDKTTRSRMQEAYGEMKDEKIKQYCFGFGGAGIGLICLIGGEYYGGSTNNQSLVLGGAFIGANVFLVGQILSNIAKKNRWAKARKIANIYNGNE